MNALEPVERAPSRPWWGYLGWMWSAGSWLSLLAAGASWGLSAASVALTAVLMLSLAAFIELGNGEPTFIAIVLGIMGFILWLLVLGLAIAAAGVLALVAGAFHVVGLASSVATILSPSAPWAARLSGVPPFVAHAVGVVVVLIGVIVMVILSIQGER